jgi:hypothetical protein
MHSNKERTERDEKFQKRPKAAKKGTGRNSPTCASRSHSAKSCPPAKKKALIPLPERRNFINKPGLVRCFQKRAKGKIYIRKWRFLTLSVIVSQRKRKEKGKGKGLIKKNKPDTTIQNIDDIWLVAPRCAEPCRAKQPHE